MRLMNVDQANSSVLASLQAYKIPIYCIQTCMGEMVCSKMEIFIVLMGHHAGVKLMLLSC